jgi:hypothetical protein
MSGFPRELNLSDPDLDPQYGAATYVSPPTLNLSAPIEGNGFSKGLGSADAEPAVARRQNNGAPLTADIVHNFEDFHLYNFFRTRCRRVAVLGPSGALKSLFSRHSPASSNRQVAGLPEYVQGRGHIVNA